MRPVCLTCGHSTQDHLMPFTPLKGKNYRCTHEDCDCQKYIPAPKEEKSRTTDDAIFVQYNKLGQVVAQWGSMSAESWPDPNEAMIMFSTLDEAIKFKQSEANETEFGFKINLRVEDHAAESDEFHTMEELYDYRMVYHAHAILLWGILGYPVVKSKRHHSGELCFDGEYFIITAKLPTGQVSNHYKLEHWNLFDCEESELAPEWDGHTPAIALNRLFNYVTGQHYNS